MGNSCPRCCETNSAPVLMHTRKNAYELTNTDISAKGSVCCCCPNSCDPNNPVYHCCAGWCCAPLMLGGTDELVTAIEDFYKSAEDKEGELAFSEGALERLTAASNRGWCRIKYFAFNNTAIGAGVAQGVVSFSATSAQVGGDSAEAGAINAGIQIIQSLLSCFILNGYSNAQRMRMSEAAKTNDENYTCPVTWCCPLNNVCFNS